jgi:hypothetical protein
MATEDIAKQEVEKADMVSLKITKEERKAREESMKGEPTSIAADEYPYSTRIDLEDDVLKKLGIKELPEVGSEMTLKAKVEVKRTSENSENGDKKRRSVCLQITRMSLTAILLSVLLAGCGNDKERTECEQRARNNPNYLGKGRTCEAAGHCTFEDPAWPGCRGA